jgi:hypothetical protein
MNEYYFYKQEYNITRSTSKKQITRNNTRGTLVLKGPHTSKEKQPHREKHTQTPKHK